MDPGGRGRDGASGGGGGGGGSGGRRGSGGHGGMGGGQGGMAGGQGGIGGQGGMGGRNSVSEGLGGMGGGQGGMQGQDGMAGGLGGMGRKSRTEVNTATAGIPGGISRGGYGGYPGMGGQSYTGPSLSFLPSQTEISPNVMQCFIKIDKDQSRHINSQELQIALERGYDKKFSELACKLMIGMFDKDYNGLLDIYEFQHLYNFIVHWENTFKQFDSNNSGNINEEELNDALNFMGYRFSPSFVRWLILKGDFENHVHISLDHFIALCVQIERLTEAFRRFDSLGNGYVSLGYEDFIYAALQSTS